MVTYCATLKEGLKLMGNIHREVNVAVDFIGVRLAAQVVSARGGDLCDPWRDDVCFSDQQLSAKDVIQSAIGMQTLGNQDVPRHSPCNTVFKHTQVLPPPDYATCVCRFGVVAGNDLPFFFCSSLRGSAVS